MVEVCEALQAMQEELTDPKVTSEAKSLENNLTSFDFIVSFVVCHDILFHLNLVSNTMQNANSDLSTVTHLLGKCQTFLKEYRETGYAGAVATAKDIAEDLEIEAVYKKQPERKKKRQFDYESRDEAPTDPEQLFKTVVFYPLIDQALTSIEQRFTQHETYNQHWVFLYNMQTLPESEILKQKYLNLQKVLQDEDKLGESDIDGNRLFEELKHLGVFLKNSEIKTPVQTLQLI